MATININFANIFGVKLADTRFDVYSDTLFILNGVEIRPGKKISRRTNSLGLASIDLAIGNYKLIVSERELTFGITGAGPYDLVDIISILTPVPVQRGLPVGGLTGQVLAKLNAGDYNTQWINQSGGGSRRFNIIPTGLINNANVTFTLSEPFVSGSETIYLNGQKQKLIDDYIVNTSTSFQLNSSPLSGETITIDYNI